MMSLFARNCAGTIYRSVTFETVAEWTVEDYLEKRRFDGIYQSMS